MEDRKGVALLCRIIDRVGAWVVLAISAARTTKLGEVMPAAVADHYIRQDHATDQEHV